MPPGPIAMLAQLRDIGLDIDKYVYLRELQRRDPRAFFALLVAHTEELLPWVYTPTVGEACQRYHELPIQPLGLYLRATDAGSFLARLRALPGRQGVRVVVVTDGERILGLGDLGAGGMAISEGKSLLYVAAAGVPPAMLLPVCLDVGTNNAALLADPAYRGLRQRRLTGDAYAAVVEEFVGALRAWRPHVVLQWEDFGNGNAFWLLDRYRPRICCLNDDIQGTAAVALGGLLSALRAGGGGGGSLAEQRVLFHGAGEAGTGIGELIAIALERRHGLTREEGRRRCYFMDSKGLVVSSRTDLQHHKAPFAHDLPPCASLAEAVRRLRPTALVGVSTSAGAFTPEVLREMAAINAAPIIFPLSNPTSQAECSFEDAVDATGGRLHFASGSPFAPLRRGGRLLTPSQANNAYVFPAIGHAAVLCCARAISDDVFLTAAEALAAAPSADERAAGLLFPRFSRINPVSAQLIGVLAAGMCSEGAGAAPADFQAVVRGAGLPAGASDAAQWEAYARAKMFDPAAPRL